MIRVGPMIERLLRHSARPTDPRFNSPSLRSAPGIPTPYPSADSRQNPAGPSQTIKVAGALSAGCILRRAAIPQLLLTIECQAGSDVCCPLGPDSHAAA